MDHVEAGAVGAVAPPDMDGAIATLTLAFGTDPMARWSLPDPGRYLAIFPAVVRAMGGRALDHGTADRAAGLAGVALWLPPGVGMDEEALGAIMAESLSADRQEEALAIFEQMADHHPSGPHWYLAMIGVDPSCQGKGYGSALLEHALRRCDRDGLPAYLESSNPANVPLYERHGFSVRGRIQVGSSPNLVPMLREPR
jgi:ribosomal protein S18 acetylase RimI-like enzyme